MTTVLVTGASKGIGLATATTVTMKTAPRPTSRQAGILGSTHGEP